MAARILLVGSVMMDLILRCERAPQPSESVLGHDYRNAPGGKGSNAAVAAARAGAHVSAYATVGKDANGEYLLARWKDEGVDTKHTIVREGANTGFVAITLEDSGQNRLIIFPGANMLTPPDQLEEAFQDPFDAVLLQFEIPFETNARAIELANSKGIITVLDAGPAQKYDLEKLPPVTILSPNETETKALVGIYPSDEATMKEASMKLAERNGCKYVVLKLGDRGSYIYGEGLEVLVPPYKVNAIDPTAAGDAFTGVLAKAFAETRDIVESAKIANAAGALTCTKLGAQPSLPTAAEIEAFLAQQ
ncbi:ribokinase [Proteiniclasticum sp. BAD-10]|uniref:Deoxyribokinase n=1 Tax=Proteiniclasticum sediminis TaxID=2804028 RepID=A0A941HQP7_9CLOT|nr:ribokinase [Proteiniclasticum sediminis]MBR0576734.1 ribokinase [Proteiniclasticum sediminis]